MSKVITFSRIFPAHHPKAGQPTYFVEKLITSFDQTQLGFEQILKFPASPLGQIVDLKIFDSCQPKHHTIRAGHRFKVGDKFSPRV